MQEKQTPARKRPRKKTNLNITLPDDLKLRLVDEAKQEVRSLREQVEFILRSYFEKKEVRQ